MENSPYLYSAEAIFRYSVVSQVLTRELGGELRSSAVEAVADSIHITMAGEIREARIRTIYRWLAAHEAEGFKGLIPKERVRDQYSVVLPLSLLDFFKAQKTLDPQASVPELIKRSQKLGLQGSETANRITVWRSLNRMGVDTAPRKSIRTRDARRFAYPHRMNMLLCDGKHFRAGIQRLRRVALFFLDDATRKGLEVVVGTSENAPLFLRGLYQVFSRYGLSNAIYMLKITFTD